MSLPRRVIITKYLGPTNYKPARVKATEADGQSVTLDWDNNIDYSDSIQQHIRAAKALATRLNQRYVQALVDAGNPVEKLTPSEQTAWLRHYAVGWYEKGYIFTPLEGSTVFFGGGEEGEDARKN